MEGGDSGGDGELVVGFDGRMETWEWGMFAVSADEKSPPRDLFNIGERGATRYTRAYTAVYTTAYTGVYTGVSPYRTRLARSLVAVK